MPAISSGLAAAGSCTRRHAGAGPTTFRAVWLAGGLCLALGCRQKTTFGVSGSVSFDGEPVSNGQILFLPADSSAAPNAGRIENGTYHSRPLREPSGFRSAPPGAVGEPPPGALGPEYQDYIPARYNTDSTLTADVQPNDENRLDFHLEP